MSNTTDSFLSNECMNAITELSRKNPNDMDFGKAVRSFIHETKQGKDKNQTEIPFTQPDMGDVDEH